jgi:transglutaminase-like putative cysteine protease
MADIVRTMTEIDALIDRLRPIVNGEVQPLTSEVAIAEAIWDTVRWFTDRDCPNPVESNLEGYV